MRWGVVTFPGSLDDADTVYALRDVLGHETVQLWHKEHSLRDVDAVLLPGGFSYGDYLRAGALARFSPVMESVIDFARGGGLVMGLCNGFQVLCEAGLLPGALVANRSLTFVCRQVQLRVERADLPFTHECEAGDVLELPIKHGDGCYVTQPETLRELEDRGQVVVRYVDAGAVANEAANPNGSLGNVAGLVNEAGNVFGMMPHAEHACEGLQGGVDGRVFFLSVASWVRRAGRGGG